jgi:hypothetical protein
MEKVGGFVLTFQNYGYLLGWLVPCEGTNKAISVNILMLVYEKKSCSKIFTPADN